MRGVPLSYTCHLSRSMYCRSLLGGRYIAAMFVVVEVYFSGSHF